MGIISSCYFYLFIYLQDFIYYFNYSTDSQLGASQKEKVGKRQFEKVKDVSEIGMSKEDLRKECRTK